MRKMKLTLTAFTMLLLGLLAPPFVGNAGAAAGLTPQGTLLTELLDELSEQYQVFFAYDADLLRGLEVADRDLSKYESLEDAVNGILQKSGLRYDLVNTKYCVIYRDNRQGTLDKRKLERKIRQINALEKKGNLSLQRNAGADKAGLPIQAITRGYSTMTASVTVSGVITDENNEPLIGVNILEMGTSNGTITDLDGSYSLTVEDDAVLRISYTGYLLQEVPVNGRTLINIQMSTDVQSLNEIVVIGYGAVKKSDLTGAVGSVNNKDIVRANPILPAKALQGQVAGVNVAKINSRPGAEYTIDIRGLSSIDKSNEPLVVIDGVMGGNLNTLNPTDIASMDVLKDASATAIYGSRGANGVIIITTKRGTSGKPQVTYDAYVGTKVPAHLPDMMTAQQFYKAYHDARLLDGGKAVVLTSTELANVESGRNTDWIDLVTEPGLQTSHVLAVSGGSENTTYHFSTGYLQEEGNLLSTNFDRVNLKGTVDSRLNDIVKVGFSSYYTYSTQNLGSNESLRSAYRARPTGSGYFPDLVNPAENNDSDFQGYAIWMGINDKQVLNPIVEALPENYQDENRISSLLANAYVELSPIRNLSFRSSFSASTFGLRGGEFRGTFTKDRKTTLLPRAQYDTDQRTSYTWDNILNYKLDVGSGHALNFTAVQSALQERRETSTIAVQNLPFNSGWYSLGTAGTITGVGSNLTEKALLSYMGRVNYGFRDKYLLTVTGRWDGSSVLAEGNKWAFFPSAALAWRLDQEPFIQDLGLFSALKARVSYGVVGNDVVDPYGTQATLVNTAYDFDGSAAFGFAPRVIANSDLRWEKSKEINVGLDMGFLNNRLTASVELYKRNTVDLILNQKIPTSSGFSSVTSNVGEVLNQGVEVTLNTVNVSKGDFRWNTRINFSTNHNEILELYGDGVTVDKGNKLFVGESLKSNFFYEFDGIWQLNEADQAALYKQVPGSVKVVDQNGDGVISSSDNVDDRVVLGSALPKWLAGMTNTFNYKNWDFSFFVYTRQGAQFRNSLLSGTFGDLSSDRYNHLNLNYWTSENPTNDYYGVVAANPYREAIQYQEANFVRISDITLGFSLPKGVLDRMKFGNFRIYGQVINPFVFTDYVSLDPEFNSGTYQDDVPNATYLFGVSVGF